MGTQMRIKLLSYQHRLTNGEIHMKTASHMGLRGASGALVGILFACSATLTRATPYNNAVLADNPLLYWTFDEPGGDAYSQVNNTAANQLAPLGNAMRASSHPALGSAASFDGSNGTGFKAADLFGATNYISSQLWAEEFWFKPANNTARYISEMQEIRDKAPKGNGPAFIYGYGAPAQTNALEINHPSQVTPRLGVQNVDPGSWHHVVFAFYGNKGGFATNLREMYVDGALVVSDTTSNFSTGHGLMQFVIGSDLGLTATFFGLIDEYAIYELGGLADFNARQARVQSIAGHYAIVTIPEPSSMVLLGMGAISLMVSRRRGRKSEA